MRLLRIAALVGALAPVSCGPTSPSDLPSAYAEVIRSEWSLAQALLVDVSVSGDLAPELCTWIPHDGMFLFEENRWANGEFRTPCTITFNVHTPTVIRHEAGHAILYMKGHPCWRCWSVNGRPITMHGTDCDGTLTGRYCTALLEVYYDN